MNHHDNDTSIITLYSPLPPTYSGRILCTYDHDSVVVWREVNMHRIPVQSMKTPVLHELYFLGPDLVVVTDVGSLLALRVSKYEFLVDPRLVSAGDRITSIATHSTCLIAIG